MLSISTIERKFAVQKYRWFAMVFIALGLAIVIIDNTILNVSIPYILNDLNTNLSSIEWAISGYSLVIAMVLITVGRVGDIIGRKKIFLIGVVIFAAGSFIGSTAQNVLVLIVGRGLIQAIGAAMTLTSALALVSDHFRGSERAWAFAIWGAIAGASASVGPILGGYLTTYYSWRWSLRINVIISLIAILGYFFIQEFRGKRSKFDLIGVLLSSLGLLLFVFSFVEGQTFGWLRPSGPLTMLGMNWPFASVSVIPFAFFLSIFFLFLFFLHENKIEKSGGEPLLRPSSFLARNFSAGSATLLFLTVGLFGVSFVLPIFLENALSLNALGSGLIFLSSSGSLFVFGLSSAYASRKFGFRNSIFFGLILISAGLFWLGRSLNLGSDFISLAPALVLFGGGFGLASSQLNNIIVSSAPAEITGEASAVSITARQVGASIGVAIIGAIFMSNLSGSIAANVRNDRQIPENEKAAVIQRLQGADIEGGELADVKKQLPGNIGQAAGNDANHALASASEASYNVAIYFTLAGAVASFFIIEPKNKNEFVAAE